jgi:hypothetical protein
LHGGFILIILVLREKIERGEISRRRHGLRKETTFISALQSGQVKGSDSHIFAMWRLPSGRSLCAGCSLGCPTFACLPKKACGRESPAARRGPAGKYRIRRRAEPDAVLEPRASSRSVSFTFGNKKMKTLAWILNYWLLEHCSVYVPYGRQAESVRCVTA